MIQRKRTKQFFGYGHRFEAYVPKQKRLFGYFALSVLAGEDIVAAIDLKTDRKNRQLLVQKWSWVGNRPRKDLKRRIEQCIEERGVWPNVVAVDFAERGDLMKVVAAYNERVESRLGDLGAAGSNDQTATTPSTGASSTAHHESRSSTSPATDDARASRMPPSSAA